MIKTFLFCVLVASFQGYCFSQGSAGKIPTLSKNDTLINLKPKLNFHYVLPGKVGIEIMLSKTGAKILFENHTNSVIWFCENNDQVEARNTINFIFAPDLSLLSPLYFRKIPPDKYVVYDLNYSTRVRKLELAVVFILNLELLKKSIPDYEVQLFKKIDGEDDLFYASSSIIPSDCLSLFNLKKFALNSKGRSKIRIINLPPQ